MFLDLLHALLDHASPTVPDSAGLVLLGNWPTRCALRPA